MNWALMASCLIRMKKIIVSTRTHEGLIQIKVLPRQTKRANGIILTCNDTD